MSIKILAPVKKNVDRFFIIMQLFIGSLLLLLNSCAGDQTTVAGEQPAAEVLQVAEQTMDTDSTEPVEGMVWIAGGHLEREGRAADLAGFYIDSTEVTVAMFREFIEATGFKTEAEAFGWSGVFNTKTQTWDPVNDATWEYPQGPDKAKAKANEPVTQVSWNDATAYAKWAGKRLPTETEWIWAASQRGTQPYLNWGDELIPDGKYMGNWWQGIFPYKDTGDDGFLGIAPVKSFPPDPNGLYDVGGNVWEWTNDLRYPQDQANPNPEMVIKGGSFLCAENYCAGYELDSHQFTPKDSGLNHLGFRCVKN
ncbi:MAG: SUMF1/EgtB/PvdO family nonheme iron enzyme [Saprospiraceae bacterium]